MKRKKVAKLMAVVALIGAVGVGGSFALLTAKTTPVWMKLMWIMMKT